VKRLETERFKSKITMDVKHMRPLFKNMRFYYRRKTFPKLEDYGTADVDLTAGQGVRIKIAWLLEGKGDRPLELMLAKVKCTIDKLDIHIIEAAKHEFLDKVATSLFIGQIKQNIAQAIVNNIVQMVEPFNAKMNEFLRTRPLERLSESASKQINYAYEQAKETVQQVQPTLQKVGEQIKETAKQAWENPQATTEDLKGKASQKIEEVKEKVSDLKDQASQKLEEAKDTVKSSSVNQSFGGGVQPVVEIPIAGPNATPEDRTLFKPELKLEKRAESPLVPPKVAK